MGLSNKFTDEIKEVDVIIVGGGTAGCVVASRLAAAAPNLHVLVVEGGRDNYKDPLIINPFAFIKNQDPSAKTALFFRAGKSEDLGGRELVVPTGGILGGGSSINFLMYTRGHRSDFESWNTPGWGPDDMLPFLKKAETYHGTGSAAVHGSTGPIHISSGTYRNEELTTDFIRAVTSLGFPETADLQDLESVDAVSRHLRFVSPAGDRSDSAHAYLHPLLRDGQHPNLHVLVEHNVSRVLFDDDDDKQACGIELVPNPLFHPQSPPSPPFTVKSRLNAVVLSAGALCTPSILERSGIGAAAVLERAGVPLKVDLPAVGENLQDHHMLLVPFRSAFPPEVLGNVALLGDIADVPRQAEALSVCGRRGSNFIEAAAKLRPSADEVEALGADFREGWERDYVTRPGRGLVQICMAGGFPGPNDEPSCENIALSAFTLYPYSRGSVHITGPSPTSDEPAFDSGIFSSSPSSAPSLSSPSSSVSSLSASSSSSFDVAASCWTYKKLRDIARRLDSYRGEVAYAHPPFPQGSGAALSQLPVDGPSLAEKCGGPDKVPKLVYSAEDDAVLEAYVRNAVQTTWHTLGSVRMGPREGDGQGGPKGAVDSSLNVYGVKGLKVVDLSIVPENIGGNTNMTAIAIGEKGADILLRELGILKTN
ncbi:hypothetical protein MCOR03_001745 [Pyricularia oryzae]|nr:hypothetical protein MCOR15_011211 [Pyricularia oryzae]KAI6492673.1 hypothetical protein MCOR13_007937 [Pyricularia oryzae]KAI6515089.1 hypothetical protein MCOR10_008353 [Pyricularia oryzae]KAI6527129.1 hypothetical protein MCOR16_005865 [Pyricularia oryzae]KAI6539581.1 hypothetical protein MCOR05_004569 [Pyricularia oryzae]